MNVVRQGQDNRPARLLGGQPAASYRRAVANAPSIAERRATLLAARRSTASGEDAAAVTLAAHDGLAVQIAIGHPGGRGMTPAELADSIVAPLETAAAAEGRRSAAM